MESGRFPDMVNMALATADRPTLFRLSSERILRLSYRSTGWTASDLRRPPVIITADGQFTSSFSTAVDALPDDVRVRIPVNATSSSAFLRVLSKVEPVAAVNMCGYESCLDRTARGRLKQSYDLLPAFPKYTIET